MTAYTCPTHGVEYDDDGLQLFKGQRIGAYCPGCIEAKDKAARLAQAEFETRYRTWHHWQRWSGIPNRGRNRTLANWQPHGKAQQAAAGVVSGYARAIARQVEEGRGLTLLGPPGVGKTHLCYGLIAAAHEAGTFARYIVWADVIDRTKAAYATKSNDDRGLLDELKRSRLLVLDEIGVRQGTEFDQALLFDLIDARYRNELPTIVASNLTADTLDCIGERTADRLRETNITVPIPGDSQRQSAATNRDLIDAPAAIDKPEAPRILVPVCIDGQMVDKPLSIHVPAVWA